MEFLGSSGKQTHKQILIATELNISSSRKQNSERTFQKKERPPIKKEKEFSSGQKLGQVILG